MKRRLSESELETPMDFGNEFAISQDDGGEEPVDVIDEAIWSLMDEIVAFGSTETTAEKKVQDAIDKLVKDEIIIAVPERYATDGVKAAWVADAIPRVKNYLKMKGDMF